MKNAGENIKVMAVFLFILGLIVSVIWFVIVAVSFSSASTLLIFVFPSCLLLSTIVSYFLMYGFGQLVENSDIMVRRQSDEFREKVFKELRDDLNNVNDKN